MTSIPEYDGETNALTQHDTRQAFRATVAQVAAKARAILPTQVNGRIEAAVKLVLSGEVEPQPDGTVKVGSSDPTRSYVLEGHACTCTDFTQGKAPQSWCKHRIAAGIQKRVHELMPPPPTIAPPAAALPEAPASLNFRAMVQGYEVQMTLRGASEDELLARLQKVLQRADVRPVPKPAPRSGQWRKSA